MSYAFGSRGNTLSLWYFCLFKNTIIFLRQFREKQLKATATAQIGKIKSVPCIFTVAFRARHLQKRHFNPKTLPRYIKVGNGPLMLMSTGCVWTFRSFPLTSLRFSEVDFSHFSPKIWRFLVKQRSPENLGIKKITSPKQGHPTRI